MVLPSDSAFFDLGPALAAPRTDGGFVTLGGARDGLLRSPAEPLEDAAQVGAGVRDPELLLHELHDTRAGPDVAAEAVVLGALREQVRELLELLGREFRRCAGSFAAAQRLGAMVTSGAEPLADGAWGDVEGAGYVDAAPALLVKVIGAQAAILFPVLRWVVHAAG